MTQKLRVFFDGACPLCKREIRVYQDADTTGQIDWVDISRVEPLRNLPLPVSTLLARFHVQTSEGELISGARGFIQMWRHLPKWRWLAIICSTPGLPSLLELSYRGFLMIRPMIQRILIRK